MSKNTEDTLMEVYQEVEKNNLREKFNKQLIKMSTQSKHKWKTICEKYEYALMRIKK